MDVSVPMEIASINDPLLGPCRWVEELSWYECTPFRRSTAIKMRVQAQQFPSREAAFAEARRVFQSFAALEARAKAFAVQHLLQTKNESWREDGDPEIWDPEGNPVKADAADAAPARPSPKKTK